MRLARLGLLALALWGVALLPGCVTPPPARLDDLCAIFGERAGWYRAARESAERWGVSEAIQLAIVHQESRFRANARPPRGHFLWIFPGRRPSSAYGYGQVIDTTWRTYENGTRNWGADRDDFRFDPMVQALNESNVSVYSLNLLQDVFYSPTEDFLARLASETGGDYFRATGTYKTPLKRIENENNGYYMLSYASQKPKDEHGYQQIVVKLKNPQFRIKSREGYKY